MSRWRWMLAACLVSTAVATPAEPALPDPLRQADEAAAPLVPEHQLNAYFSARPKTFLIDPQHLLDPHATRELLAELAAHAAESPIDLFIYVFGKDQQLPSEMHPAEWLARGFTTGRPAAIVFYFLGQPQQTALHLSPALTAVIPPANQQRAQEIAVMAATAKSEPYQQLEAFTTQLAIQIYGMERLLDRHQEQATTADAASHPHSGKAPKKPSAVTALIERWRPAVVPHLLHGAVTLAALSVTLALGWWWRRRATFRLPEFEVEPRMGGGHAAGIGAVISFASPTLPPASQRDQMPDYLQRRPRKF
ncbi:MAG: hypothetical protein RLZZ522_1110 [Verrucomicrobiota bacterium]